MNLKKQAHVGGHESSGRLWFTFKFAEDTTKARIKHGALVFSFSCKLKPTSNFTLICPPSRIFHAQRKYCKHLLRKATCIKC